MTKDPICGMNVNEKTALSLKKNDEWFYFCSENCKQKFLKKSSAKKSATIGNKVIYTCPMHPEIKQDKPGDCPKCGMYLEQKAAPAGEDDNEEARMLARKF